MEGQLPTFDEFIGNAESQAAPSANKDIPDQLPTFDEFLSTPPKKSTAEEIAERDGATKRVMNAFGSGLKEGTDNFEQLGLSPETERSLKKAGIYNDYANGEFNFGKAVVQGLVTPAAAALDAMFRAPSGIITGAGAASGEVGKTIAGDNQGIPGQPTTLRQLAALPFQAGPELAEYALSSPLLGEFHGGGPIAETVPRVVREGQAHSVVGVDEAQYMGTKPLTEEQTIAQRAATEEVVPAPVPEAKDIHTVARELAPETFIQYDRLTARKDTLRDQLNDLSEERTKAIDDQIDAIKEAKQGGFGKLQSLQEKREAILAAGDTPEMAEIRQKIQSSDYQLRDLAPEVSTAYRAAEAHLPRVEEAPEAQKPAPQETAEVQPSNAEVPAEQPTPAAKPIEEQRSYIIDDFKQRALAAGSTPELADAHAQLEAARYQTLAEQYPKYSAQEWYDRESADLRTGREKTKARELAQINDLDKTKNETTGLTYNETLKEAASRPKTAEINTPERQALREKIANDYYGEGAKKKDGIIHIVMGVPGAGKSSTIFDGLVKKTGAIGIDADHIKEMLPEYDRGLGSDAVHTESQKISYASPYSVLNKAVSNKDNIVLSVVGQNYDVLKGIIEKLKEKGYNVHLDHVDVTDKNSAKRVADRFSKNGRAISPDYLKGASQKVRDVYERTKSNVNGYSRIDNNGTEPNIAESRNNPDTEISLRSRGRRDGGDTGDAQANGRREELEQSSRGKIRLATDDAKATITLMKSSNASTLIHEKGHEWTDQLLRLADEEGAPEQLKKDAVTLRKYGGAKEDGTLPTRGHEKIARGFERYLMEGTAPSKELARIFAKFKQWLTAIYQTVERLKSPISDDIRDVFDRLLSANPEKTVIAPDHEPGAMLANIHEADAKHTPPEHAAPVAENVRKEVKSTAKSHSDEAENVIATAETGRGAEDIRGNQQTPDNAPAQEPAAVSASGDGAAPEGNPVRTEPAIESATSTKSTASRTAAGTASEHASTNAEGKSPEDPNAPLGRSKSNLVDKAGNIRLDNLNTPEDVNEVLRQTAQDNDNFMQARRGIIPAAEQLNLADALGMQPWELNFRKIGEAFNAEQIIAARKLLIQSAQNVRDLMNGTDVLAYAEAKQRHLMIQEQVSGITAEAGRALGAFRKLEGSQEANALGEFLKQATGKDLFQLEQEMQFGKNLETPAQVAKFLDATKKATFRDMIIEYYINALISGPVTHLRYSVGNALNALVTPLFEIPFQSAIGTVREAVTGKVDADRIYLGEALAQLHGIMKGSQDGLKAAATAFKTGQSPLLPTEHISANYGDVKLNAIPGKIGQVINIPSKSVSAIHSFFKSIRYEQNIQALAYRTAVKEGLEGDAFTNRVADLSVNPTEDMMKNATGNALKELYMAPTEYNSTMGALNRAVNSNLAAKIIMPFMKIGSQITRNAFVERTPLGLFDKEVRENILGEHGNAARDTQLGKMAVGTSLMGATSLMVLEGNATGDGPNDPAQRAIWLLNHRPNSIQIGDITIPYQGLGHLGMLMRFSANMTETAHGWNEEDGVKLATSFMEGITKSVLDENFMRGLKDMLDAIYHPAEYGSNYIRSFATNWLPFSIGLSQVARKVDPSQREAHDIFDVARSKIPFISEQLMPRRDRFGEAIPNGAPLPKYQNDPVVQRLEALQIGVGKLDRKIRGVQLTDQQYDDYSRIAGKMTKMRLDEVVKNPGFSNIPQVAQMDTIKKIIESSRETARQIILMQNPSLIKQAADAKIQALKGTKKGSQ